MTTKYNYKWQTEIRYISQLQLKCCTYLKILITRIVLSEIEKRHVNTICYHV